MSDLRDLYQEMILDHGKNPRNFQKPADSDREAEGQNPLCGDEVTVYLRVADGVIEDAGFTGQGCAISTASASMMTQALKGMTIEEAEALAAKFKRFVTQDEGAVDPDELAKLAVLGGVRDYPTRVKCATLAWHTLGAALKGAEAPVSTE